MIFYPSFLKIYVGGYNCSVFWQSPECGKLHNCNLPNWVATKIKHVSWICPFIQGFDLIYNLWTSKAGVDIVYVERVERKYELYVQCMSLQTIRAELKWARFLFLNPIMAFIMEAILCLPKP